MKSKSIVLTFGRFQPITQGHAKLINTVVDYGKRHGVENRIYTSQSFDSKKNPIPYREKVSYLRALFPGANIMDDRNAISIFHVARILSDEGYNDVTLVVGSDRVASLERDIKRYIKSKDDRDFDPNKHFNFTKFKVVSAGERDPDAEGVTGISGTKMRDFVRTNNFEAFLKGLPTNNVNLARKIFGSVKRNLSEDMILEGINDKSVLKAVFLLGGPGSGKDYILNSTIRGLGFVEINSDIAFEFLMRKHNLSFKMPDSETERRDRVRDVARSMTASKEAAAIIGRTGLIINSTAHSLEKIEKIKRKLTSLGYDTMMIFVDTKNEVSRFRNQQRPRSVPEPIRQEKWTQTKENLEKMKRIFPAKDLIVIDNSLDIRKASVDNRKEFERKIISIYKHTNKFINAPVSNPIGKKWMSDEKKNRGIKEAKAKFEKYKKTEAEVPYDATINTVEPTYIPLTRY